MCVDPFRVRVDVVLLADVADMGVRVPFVGDEGDIKRVMTLSSERDGSVVLWVMSDIVPVNNMKVVVATHGADKHAAGAVSP